MTQLTQIELQTHARKVVREVFTRHPAIDTYRVQAGIRKLAHLAAELQQARALQATAYTPVQVNGYRQFTEAIEQEMVVSLQDFKDRYGSSDPLPGITTDGNTIIGRLAGFTYDAADSICEG